MSVLDKVRLIIYRCHEKGLEIFTSEKDQMHWPLILEKMNSYQRVKMIELDPVEDDGELVRTYAIEGDWHDIPGLRDMIRTDVEFVKSKIKGMMSDMEQGSYVAFKEVFKKALPSEYAALKELKEVIVDRNLGTYI